MTDSSYDKCAWLPEESPGGGRRRSDRQRQGFVVRCFGLAKALLGFEAHFHRANYRGSQALPGQLRQLAGQFVGFGVLEIEALHNSTIYGRIAEMMFLALKTV